MPVGPNLQLFRRFTFGRLAQFHVLDTRQFRSDQPCDDTLGPRCDAALDPAATMTSQEQENWLFRGLNRSRARWNILAQQTMFAQYNFGNSPLAPGDLFNPDQWDGYVAARQRLLEFLQARKPANPVVITGDIHSSWVHDLKADFDDPSSATLGTEFAGTSISSLFTGNEAQASAARRWRQEVTCRLPEGCDRGLVFSFGVNDTTLENGRTRINLTDSLQNTHGVLSAAQAIAPVLMVGPPPIADPDQNQRIEQLSQQLAGVCQQLGVPYLAVFALLKTSAVWLQEAAANDGAHPRAEGYTEMAQLTQQWSAWRAW